MPMHCFQKVLRTFALILFLAGIGTWPSTCRAGMAQAQLEASVDQILEILRDPDLKSENRADERRQKLRKIADQRFDYEKMTQLSLGRHWNNRTREEKDQIVPLFSKLLETTYLSKIESYTDEKVVFVRENLNKKKAQVDTKIITKTVEIPINYRMYETDQGTWMVYDLVIEGVSMVGNYRSQFSQILDRQSFEDLVKKLKEKEL